MAKARLKTLEQEVSRFWSKVIILSIDNCWEWQGGINHDGYGNFYTNSDHIFAHIFSWESTFGKITNKDSRVLHKCDNPKCVNPNHLFLGTQQDNIQDMMNKGRQGHRFGRVNGRTVLSESDVYEIRKLREGGMTYKGIAKKKNVSEGCVNHVLNGRHWTWLS